MSEGKLETGSGLLFSTLSFVVQLGIAARALRRVSSFDWGRAIYLYISTYMCIFSVFSSPQCIMSTSTSTSTLISRLQPQPLLHFTLASTFNSKSISISYLHFSVHFHFRFHIHLLSPISYLPSPISHLHPSAHHSQRFANVYSRHLIREVQI